MNRVVRIVVGVAMGIGALASHQRVAGRQAKLSPRRSPGSTRSAVPTPEASAAPMHVGGDVTEPVPIYRPQPASAGRVRTVNASTLIFEAVIQADGSVTSVRVLRPNPVPAESLPCVQAYIRTIETWRYKPAGYRGKPVPVFLTMSVHHSGC